MSNGTQAPVKPGIDFAKLNTEKKSASPTTFSFVGVIGAFKPYEGKQLVTFMLPDGDEYGVTPPNDNYPIGLQCELACEVPKGIGFTDLVRVTGRFGVFGVQREVNSFNGGYNQRGPRQQQETKVREYQNFRFVVEKLEVVPVAGK